MQMNDFNTGGWTSTSTSNTVPVVETVEKTEKSIDEQMEDISTQIADLAAKGVKANAAAIAKLGVQYSQLEAKKSPTDEPLEKPLGEYSQEDISKKSKEEIKKDAQKELAEKAMKEVGWRQYTGSKADLIASLTKQLNEEKANTAKKEEEAREMLFAKEKISPRDLFNRWKLGNIYEIMKHKKAIGNQALIDYCMSMQKYRLGRKLISPLKRLGLKTWVAWLFGVDRTNIMEHMETFQKRFEPTAAEAQAEKEWKPSKVGLMKKNIYNMVADITKKNADDMAERNTMQKLK